MKRKLLTKEFFLQCMNAIREQEEKDAEFTSAINLVFDGYPVYMGNDKLTSQMIKLLEVSMGLENDDLISWYLYESSSDARIWDKDGNLEADLKSDEDLYNYLVWLQEEIEK